MTKIIKTQNNNNNVHDAIGVACDKRNNKKLKKNDTKRLLE